MTLSGWKIPCQQMEYSDSYNCYGTASYANYLIFRVSSSIQRYLGWICIGVNTCSHSDESTTSTWFILFLLLRITQFWNSSPCMLLPAVRKIRIITNKPVHRGHTSGLRSLAYVNAGAHYMRQMSGLLKDKVNSLRQNALNDTPTGSTTFPSFVMVTSLLIVYFVSPYLWT